MEDERPPKNLLTSAARRYATSHCQHHPPPEGRRRGRPSSRLARSAGLLATTQRINQEGKRWVWLPATRVVEMVSGKRSAPILEYPLEVAFCDMGFSQVLRHIGHPETADRC